MKRLKYIVILSILGVFLLAMVAIVPARADKPVRYEIDTTFNECGIELPLHLEESVQLPFKCNPATELCGYTEHLTNSITTLTNPDNGRTLTFRGASSTRYTWINWYETLIEFRGVRFMGTIPGYGPVFGNPGRLVTYETCTGEYPDNWLCEQEILQDSGPTFDDIETICNYMLNGE
jgi:hypothetical protein